MSLTQINKAGLDEIALDHVFTIGASGSSAYTFQGEGLNGTVNNPTLYLTRGKTYRFENGSGGHPIRIQSTSGASGTAYNTGVTNNAGSGTVIVEVQHDAPDVLYYQCTSHAAMNGILYITGALADGGVTTAKIADDAVTGAKIADDAINSEHYTDGSIDTAHIADAQITTSKIADSQITTAKINDNAVTTAKIADQAVTLAKLPHGDGSSDGKFLRANNGADPSFETITGTTINNNADNRLITGSGSANTLEGEANLTYNGTRLNVATGDLAVTGGSGADAQLRLIADEGDHGGEYWRLESKASNHNFNIATYASGSWANKVSILSGGGLTFNGDTAAANAIDDYEEGTWTPGLKGTGSNPAISYIVQRGYYSKIGSLVHVWFDIAWNSKSGGSGNFIINPLPFATGHTYYHGFGIVTHGSGLSDGGHGPRGIYANANSTSAYVIQADENFYVVLTSHLANNGHIFGGFTYRVNT